MTYFPQVATTPIANEQLYTFTFDFLIVKTESPYPYDSQNDTLGKYQCQYFYELLVKEESNPLIHEEDRQLICFILNTF